VADLVVENTGSGACWPARTPERWDAAV
jgi:hypothetical protein